MHLNHGSRASSFGQSGIALVISLLALVVVAGLGLLMFTRTMNEVRHSSDDARIVQTLMLARGGANVGSGVLMTDAMAFLYDIVMDTSKPGRWSYGKDPVSGVHSAVPDALEVAKDLVGVATRLQTAVDAIVCGIDPMGGQVNATSVSLRVYFTERACGSTIALPPDVTLPAGRYVDGPARIEGIDIGIQEYALPYVLVSEAEVGDYQRNIVVQGEYIFSVGEAPFSHYAYFTNRESDDGGRIYFTDRTMIDGPTHTNGHFSFYKTPWFGGPVTSVGCVHNNNTSTYRNNCENNPSTRRYGAYFNSNNRTNDTQMGSPPGVGVHRPEFSAGVSWRAQYVPLPTNSHSQQTVALGTGRDDQGITFNGDLASLTMFAGDVNGNSPSYSNGSWAPPATYQYITASQDVVTGSTTLVERRQRSRSNRWSSWGSWTAWTADPSCQASNSNTLEVQCRSTTAPVINTVTTRYRFNVDGLLQLYNEATGQWDAQAKPFNGVVYINGDVARLRGPDRAAGYSGDGTRTPPAVAAFAQMTLATPGDLRITSDIRYEQPPCSRQPRRVNGVAEAALCQNLSHPNVLGLYTSNGDIIVGNANSDASLNAPNDVHVHAVLMSSSSQIRVENYQTGRRGDFNLLGGMIQENRGIFGLVDTSGFERVYTYDPRMRLGLAPPFFPTTGLGSVQEVRLFSFGQREQLY